MVQLVARAIRVPARLAGVRRRVAFSRRRPARRARVTGAGLVRSTAAHRGAALLKVAVTVNGAPPAHAAGVRESNFDGSHIFLTVGSGKYVVRAANPAK